MTKAEFSEQFKRLRVAGYRLPVFLPGESVKDLTDEWFKTFGGCTLDEFSFAVDELKKIKTDTFWPAPGELWAQIEERRKMRRLRAQAVVSEGRWAMSDEDTREFLSLLREARDKILRKMPHAEPQTAPQHVQDEMDRAEEA
jgi:hypothetical protein